jgi:hypothetical protein
MEAKRQASRSDAQQAAGAEAIQAFGRREGVDLVPHRLQLREVSFQVDGYYTGPTRTILAEVYARVGPTRAAQRHRVMADLLKLALIRRLLLETRPDQAISCALVFIDDEATGVVGGKSWAALAAREFGIEIAVAAVQAETIAAVRAAQTRQDLRNDQ